MNKLIVSAVAFLALTSAAHATTLDVNLGSTGTSLSYSTGGTLNPNIDIATTSQLVLNSNSIIVAPPSSLTNQYAQPSGTIFDGSYFAVLGLPNVGSSTFTLAPGQNQLSFTWGTIDSFNTLTITDSRNVVYTITGTDALNNILGSTNHVTQSDVIFTDLFGTITNAVFSSTSNSFEVANLGSSAVPLPASLPLFIAALAGMFFVARQKKNEVV